MAWAGRVKKLMTGQHTSVSRALPGAPLDPTNTTASAGCQLHRPLRLTAVTCSLVCRSREPMSVSRPSIVLIPRASTAQFADTVGPPANADLVGGAARREGHPTGDLLPVGSRKSSSAAAKAESAGASSTPSSVAQSVSSPALGAWPVAAKQSSTRRSRSWTSGGNAARRAGRSVRGRPVGKPAWLIRVCTSTVVRAPSLRSSMQPHNHR